MYVCIDLIICTVHFLSSIITMCTLLHMFIPVHCPLSNVQVDGYGCVWHTQQVEQVEHAFTTAEWNRRNYKTHHCACRWP